MVGEKGNVKYVEVWCSFFGKRRWNSFADLGLTQLSQVGSKKVLDHPPDLDQGRKKTRFRRFMNHRTIKVARDFLGTGNM
jgi:hypothetical protein